MNLNRSKDAPYIAIIVGADAEGEAVLTLTYREGLPIIGESTTDAVLTLMAAVENICNDRRIQLNAVGMDMPDSVEEEPRHSEPAKAKSKKS